MSAVLAFPHCASDVFAPGSALPPACVVCRLRQHAANYNTADLASSLTSLTKRQIFFNLAQALSDPEFVPSQATISIGTAQTLNAVTLLRQHPYSACRW